MKLSEMNARQRKAALNVYHAINWIVGGLENTLQDNPEESEEYKHAQSILNDHQALVDMIYDEATSKIYGDGFCCFNPSTVRHELRDINFCGKEFIMERIEKRLTKEGY